MVCELYVNKTVIKMKELDWFRPPPLYQKPDHFESQAGVLLGLQTGKRTCFKPTGWPAHEAQGNLIHSPRNGTGGTMAFQIPREKKM